MAVLFTVAVYPALAANFPVNNTGDAIDVTPGDSVCETAPGNGVCTLRAAIQEANALAGPDTINFNIPLPTNQSSGGDSWWRISPGSALPTITANNTIVDGTTQTTNQGDTNSLGPEIELEGTGAGAGVDGLLISSANNIVRGLVINSFNGNGININSGNGNTIEGNYIGTDATGTNDLGNGDISGIAGGGIWVSSNNNVIGGTTPASRNVISGNDNEGINLQGGAPSGNLIQGNFIGTDRTGTIALPNSDDGIALRSGSSSTTIGGGAAGAGNLISGNGGEGIHVNGSSGNTIQGNTIGADVTGMLDMGNSVNGILINTGTSGNTIGGTVSGEGNTIAYNGLDGVYVTGLSTDNNLISGNSIYSNTGLGIDLDPDGVGTGGGANNDKAAPAISSFVQSGSDFTVVATVTSSDTIEFFRANNAAAPLVNPDGSGSGEGYLYLGSCVDNGACSGPYISAVPGDAVIDWILRGRHAQRNGQ
jgi:CSLREA domain-containing protein